MKLKRTPRVNTRYWAAILAASMCGTNLGDVFPDVLKLNTTLALLVLAVLFAIVVTADALTSRGSEASYWSAILMVRAAATQIADFFVFRAHLGFVLVGVVLAAILAALIVSRWQPTSGALPICDGHYWMTMLTAGSLGTVIGDGMGHILRPAQVGIPFSAGLATLTLVAVLRVRARLGWRSSPAYWVCIVMVRWWGTNLGDMTSFSTSLLTSLIGTAALMSSILMLWREPPGRRDDPAASPRR